MDLAYSYKYNSTTVILPVCGTERDFYLLNDTESEYIWHH